MFHSHVTWRHLANKRLHLDDKSEHLLEFLFARQTRRLGAQPLLIVDARALTVEYVQVIDGHCSWSAVELKLIVFFLVFSCYLYAHLIVRKTMSSE